MCVWRAWGGGGGGDVTVFSSLSLPYKTSDNCMLNTEILLVILGTLVVATALTDTKLKETGFNAKFPDIGKEKVNPYFGIGGSCS